jgi:polyphosphate kinase
VSARASPAAIVLRPRVARTPGPSRPEPAPGGRGGERFFSRELSWLGFNRRVLELASDVELPLLERVKLFAIVASNLDEFFAVRMARLETTAASGGSRPFPDGRTPLQTLADARRLIVALQAAEDRLWEQELRPELVAEHIRVVSPEEVGSRELRSLAGRFRREIEPLLRPTVLNEGTCREIGSLELNVAALMNGATASERHVVHIGVPACLPRLVELASGSACIPLEEVILHFLDAVVGSGRIGAAVFRITRDANLAVAGDSVDVVDAVEAELLERSTAAVVRLETGTGAPRALVNALRDAFGLDESRCYESAAPLALRGLLELADMDRPELKSPPWHAVTHRAFAGGDSETLLAEIRARDVLVHHPYDPFDSSVLAFVFAAGDPSVQALNATVYRTGDASPTLASLVQAAELKKDASAFVEVKARFDERRNIDSGRSLERAGVDVVYGMPDLKVHAKLTLLERHEGSGIRRYAHIGTGNYHASNACGYEDLSLFTADEDITADVAGVFDVITHGGNVPVFRKLLVGPWYLRDGVLGEIERVTRAAGDARQARIRIKVNSLADSEIVDALYRASQSGVDVEIVTRGICVLRPGVRGVSDRIRVRSVLGRFLEHSRLLSFETDDKATTWLGSADLMPRNLDHRIEVLVPVEDDQLRRQLQGTFDALFADTAAAWELDSDGGWRRVRPSASARPVSAQQLLMERAWARHGGVLER